MNTHPPKPPLTTRRGFVFGAGFGVLALYGVWAANGAAPLSLLGSAAPQPTAGDGHSAHGDTSGGMSPAEFRRLTEAFIAANVLPDGSVRPAAPAAMDMHAPDPHAAHADMDIAAAPPPNAHAGHGAPAPVSAHAGHDMAAMPEEPPAPALTIDPHDTTPPVDVYLLAHQWGYLPSVLRLQTGVRYRFRMMAEDVAHGASLQLGAASHIVRLRARTLVEQEVQFTRPGEHLLYCTVYCGMAHDRMQGRIIVANASQGEQP